MVLGISLVNCSVLGMLEVAITSHTIAIDNATNGGIEISILNIRHSRSIDLNSMTYRISKPRIINKIANPNSKCEVNHLYYYETVILKAHHEPYVGSAT